MNERLYFVSTIILFLIIVVTAALQINVITSLGLILRRTSSDYFVLITEEGPVIHEPFPPFHIVETSGQVINNSVFTMQETIILFIGSNCQPCKDVAAALDQLPMYYGDPLRVFLIASEFEPEIKRLADALSYPVTFILDTDDDFRHSLKIKRVPFALFVDKAGTVRMKGIVNHFNHLDALLKRRGRAIEALSWDYIDT